jgi:cell division protein FtsQ
MDERIRVRRRSVNRQRGRRRISIIFPIVVLLCAGGAFLWLRSTDVFAVRQVVATATERVTTEEIAQVTSPAMGESLLKLSTGDLEEALVKLPYVRSAEVYRRFPDSLEVELSEYEPVARLLDQSGHVWLIADTGRVLEGADAASFTDLPLMVPDTSFALTPGEQVPDAVASALPLAPLFAIGEVGARLPALDRVIVSAGGYITVKLIEGLEVRLGEATELSQKLAAAADTLEQCLQNGQVLEYIDVTVPERAAVKPK